MKTPRGALEFLRRIYKVPVDENTSVSVFYKGPAKMPPVSTGGRLRRSIP
ncbi:MAG: hypothetical protein ACPLPR_05205 [Bacillota bacterium]